MYGLRCEGCQTQVLSIYREPDPGVPRHQDGSEVMSVFVLLVHVAWNSTSLSGTTKHRYLRESERLCGFRGLDSALCIPLAKLCDPILGTFTHWPVAVPGAIDWDTLDRPAHAACLQRYLTDIHTTHEAGRLAVHGATQGVFCTPRTEQPCVSTANRTSLRNHLALWHNNLTRSKQICKDTHAHHSGNCYT